MALEVSPSRQLSEGLSKLHISSPSKFKSYIANADFEDTGFDSQVQRNRSDNKYLSKLQNWSVNYGSVRQREVDVEEQEPAQWKQYMGRSADGEEPMNLVVTSSLSDLSLIPTNTFKKRGTKAGVPGLQSGLRDETDVDADADADPAQEALGVFNNVLRHQRSNYVDLGSGQNHVNSETDANPESAAAASDSSFEDSIDASAQSPSVNRVRDTGRNAPQDVPHDSSHRDSSRRDGPRGLTLITPEDAGMVFNYREGVWDQPSANVDMSTSGAHSSTVGQETDDMTTSMDAKEASFRLPRIRDSEVDQTASESRVEADTTPLSTPKLDSKFLSHAQRPKRDIRASIRRPDVTVTSTAGAGTADRSTSFHVSKTTVISAVMDAVPHQDQWTQLRQVSLVERALESLVGLDEILPALRTLDASHNKLNSLMGVPRTLTSLNCSHNRLAAYTTLHEFPELENLDLSHNMLSGSLAVLAPAIHLRRVNLSHNTLSSLNDLETAECRIETLNLSRNRIMGVLDFAEVTAWGSPSRDSPWQYLQELDLCGNNITSIKNLHLLPRLRILRLDGNPLETLKGNSSRSLRTLTLMNCTALRDLGEFPQLRVLKLSGDSFGPQALPLTLEYFQMTGGRTGAHASGKATDKASESGSIWSQLPPFLRKLELSRTGITDLPDRFQDQFPALHTLSLHDNKLSSASRVLSRLPTHLRKLDLRGNPVTVFTCEEDKELFLKATSLAAPLLARVYV
ncbi:LAMI_0F13630g1_1 [Lachancea mirantina]|uniref:LAMI_0F13630g1_1 n=1 Tax=Lachancea mirantina TaxID=1230905 RepID=A0A1G4K3H1_9SACH|nr:LAMI_0F13630g1_1 [Lachancea mirantina]